MPQLGLGVYKAEEGSEVIRAVKQAIDVGYRLIDTAAVYKNEAGVGQAIKEASVTREDLFITTKVWNSDQGYEETLQAFETSLNKLQLDYIDLYLIHWPMPKNNKYIETYHALEKLYHDGRIRAIGVSNFTIPHLERVLKECSIKPTVNQVECHPFFSQNELKAFCREHDIYIEAWSPIMRGGELLNHPDILSLSDKHKKSAAQIILRWHIQNEVIVIPKSVTPSRIEENFDVFDFTLDC
jgi:diketogulonate reductase-like aldo/keto reductase